MTSNEEELIAEVQAVLTPDLVPENFRDRPNSPMFGHCYGAAEALYHLLGGKDGGYKAMRATDDDGISHWWVLSPIGCVLDPTSAQYSDFGKTPPYAQGKGAAFRGSKRAAEILVRVKRARV